MMIDLYHFLHVNAKQYTTYSDETSAPETVKGAGKLNKAASPTTEAASKKSR